MTNSCIYVTCVCVCVCVPADACQFLKEILDTQLNNKKIEACHLESTKSVMIQGNMSNISKDCLAMYFSNTSRSGGDVNSIVHVKQHKSAVIAFEDSRG